MARRTAQSFAKRQKEMARKERAQQKAQKRAERKNQKAQGGSGEEEFELLTGPQNFLEIEDEVAGAVELDEEEEEETAEARQ